MADGVIVGSAVVQRIGDARSRPEALRNVGEFVGALAQAVRTARA
jgi:tryptophan synthase alpha subunit